MLITDFSQCQLDRRHNLQRQLYQFVADNIVSYRFKADMKLPPSRVLAQQLNIGRNTVIKAIDQLIDEGYLHSKPGSGVFVNGEFEAGALTLDQPSIKVADSHPYMTENISHYAKTLIKKNIYNGSKPHTNLPFTLGLPALDAFPMRVWQSLNRRHNDRIALAGYDHPQGYLPLRQALSDYLAHSRGVMCSSEQIIITQGAQQAISVCAAALLHPHAPILIEEPGYLGAKKAFASVSQNFTAVPLNQNFTIDVSSLLQLTPHAILYCTPTHQYPMGGIMSAPQRLALLEWAQATGTWIIEDDYDSEFHFNQKPVAALQGLNPDAPVIYMGSFSKTLFPGLRLGYLVVPKALVHPFNLIKSAQGGESPLLTQAVVADFIQEGHFARHLRRMRILYQQKWQALNDLLEQALVGVFKDFPCHIVAKSAGMHLVIMIGNIDDKALKDHLLTKGFGSSALSSYYLNTPVNTGLVLGFANTHAPEREALTHVLVSYLQALSLTKKGK